MKSRSHRPPVSETRHDDWVDGSWTVDCICGVNFDDGEEMVDCDECGVWVHTRCSRYVKSEKSFACDKCKNRNSVSGGGASSGVRNDSEEAEVAEFLVELPTKTMLDTPNPASVSSRRPFRLWANIPMEERVHVQGVPGGESSFFSGRKMSPIFGPQLWEATGYVPKKSNFQYTEFTWFGNGKAEEKKEEEMDNKGEENAKQATDGAGVLLSMSKEDNIFPTSCPKATLLDSGKRKKEQITILKRQIERKKLKTVEKERKTENQDVQDSKAGSEATSGNDLQSCKDGLSVHRSDSLGECATNLASIEHGLDPTPVNNVSADEISRAVNRRHEMHLVVKNFSKVNNDLELLTNVTESMTVKVEVPQDSGHAGGDVVGATGGVGIGPRDTELLTIPKAELMEDNPEIDATTRRPNKKLKGELVDDSIKNTRVESLPAQAMKLKSMKPTISCAIGLSGQGKVSDAPAVSSELNDSKLLDTSKSPTVDHPRFDKSDASRDNLYATMEEPIVSKFPSGTRKMSPGLEHDSGVGEELLKSIGTARSHSTNLYDHKVVAALLKPSSTSGSVVDKHGAADAKNLSVQSTHKELPEGNVGTRKQDVLADTVGHDGKCGKLKKFVKEPLRSSSLSKTSESTKFSHMSDSKRLSSDSKDCNIPSSKVSSMPSATTVHVSGEGASPQVEAAPNSRNKDVLLAEPGRGEKSCRVGTQPTARGGVNVTSTAAASPNIPAALSDEELALLLHQELNSSPRVPRVSRMRHAGSLPQLTCPGAANVLVKRTSSGGKDQNVTSRKKSKDISGEGPRGYVVANREAKKMERKPSSLDDGRQDSRCSAYQLSQKADCGPVKSVQYMKKASGTNCLSSDANGHNASASCPPDRNASEDDSRIVGCQEHHTLPGLIAEIMSEGKRMTYEELCNAVLPHWPHLRKHNGERYAYSSHSQAVLDCLRNRSEWARLVDRGPKTTASRKRRKLDADSLSIESEENEDGITKNAKDVSRSFESHQEDFPKGKRKARKRRRLTLQGRGPVRRRRRTDVVSDEDSESFSNSIGDGISGEEEVQGDDTSAVGSDASTSADDSR